MTDRYNFSSHTLLHFPHTIFEKSHAKRNIISHIQSSLYATPRFIATFPNSYSDYARGSFFQGAAERLDNECGRSNLLFAVNCIVDTTIVSF